MNTVKINPKHKKELLIQGIYELFSCISSGDPILMLKSKESIKEFRNSFDKNDYTGMYYAIRSVAEHSVSLDNSKNSVLSLIESFSLLKGEVLTHNQKLNLSSLSNSFDSGNVSVSEVSRILSEIMEDVADSVESLSSLNYINGEVKGSNYREGVDSILHSDLVISTRRIGRDLNRLTNILIYQYPDNQEFASLREEVLFLKEGPSKFFQAIDVLSKLSWAIHKINDEKINSDKEYLYQISSKFQGIARSLKSQSVLSNASLSNLIDFEKNIGNQMASIKNAGRSSKDISSMRNTVLSSIEDMEKSFVQYADEQKRIIVSQKKKISEQDELISLTVEELKCTKEDLRTTVKRANIDHLTNLNNRKGYMEKTEMLDKEWRDKEGASAIMVLDIDFFKSINDNYGHNVGDMVLTYIGSLLNKLTKIFPNCSSYRYGGEEFVVIIENTNQKTAISIAQKVRETIYNNVFRGKGESSEFKFTASIGVAFYSKGLNNSKDVFNEADKSLYHAKNNGRNMVCVANGNFKTNIDNN